MKGNTVTTLFPKSATDLLAERREQAAKDRAELQGNVVALVLMAALVIALAWAIAPV